MGKKSLKNFSIKELQKELSRRNQDRLNSLNERKVELEEEIRSLSGGITTIDTGSKSKSTSSTKNTNVIRHKVKKAGATKKRITDTIPLVDRLLKVASDGLVHTPSEFETAVLKDGWKTSATKPYYIIAAKLADMSKKNIIQRVTKGKYQLINTEQQLTVIGDKEQNV